MTNLSISVCFMLFLAAPEIAGTTHTVAAHRTQHQKPIGHCSRSSKPGKPGKQAKQWAGFASSGHRRPSATAMLMELTPQSDKCQVRLPFETVTSSRPFLVLNASTAASASGCEVLGLIVAAFVCQIQPRPARKTTS
mmetsp:Transcript_88115/g.174870  ORF Transcript_88115/g.174870 Transcript_88115/m.174870 type:complete len:137 (+) Transcript_88115:61-471(+)